MHSRSLTNTILVVDDDEDIRETLRLALEDEGYNVVTAANGLEALEYLRTSPAPSLILLDLMMPAMDGWQFCAELDRQPTRTIVPVIVVSASACTHAIPTSSAVVACIHKPVQLEGLLETIQRHRRKVLDSLAG